MPLTIVSGAPCTNGAHRRHAGNQGVVHVAAHEGGNGGGPASDEDGFDFQAFRRKEAKIDADY